MTEADPDRLDLNRVFDTVHGSNVDQVWIAGLALAGVVLRRTDQLGRERLLRGIERELREDLAEYTRIEAANHAAS